MTKVNAGCDKGSKIATNIPDLEEDSIGQYDDTVLKALDKVLAKLVAKGLKAIISPHDGNAFGINSCDVYGKTYGHCSSDPDKRTSAGDGFYSNNKAKAQYALSFSARCPAMHGVVGNH